MVRLAWWHIAVCCVLYGLLFLPRLFDPSASFVSGALKPQLPSALSPTSSHTAPRLLRWSASVAQQPAAAAHSQHSATAEKDEWGKEEDAPDGQPDTQKATEAASPVRATTDTASSPAPAASLYPTMADAPLSAPITASPPDGIMLFVPVSGFGNQVLSFAKAIALANFYNRSLVVAPLLSSHLMDRRTAFFTLSARDATTMAVQLNLERVRRYEKYFQFAHIRANTTLRPTIMLSDFIRQYGADHDCWDGYNPTPETPPYLNTNATVLCVGRAYSLKLPKMSNQHSTPIHQWLLFDQALVQDTQHWLASQRGLNVSSYACVHYRAGDFQQYLKERYVDLAGLVSVMDSIGHPLTSNTVIITNTQAADERALLHRLGWSNLNLSSVPVPVELPILREMKQIFMEQYICQQAPVFVGCRYSSFSGLIGTMRHCGYDNEHCFNYCNKR